MSEQKPHGQATIADGDQDLVSDKGCRWFLRVGGKTTYSQGFVNKAAASGWIDSLGYSQDARAGFWFRVKGLSSDCAIVDRKGNEATI